jgi:hypothetical protein
VYKDLQDKLTLAQAQVTAEKGSNKALKETLNWLMARVNSLEKERAVLLHKFFDVKIPVAEIELPPAEVLPNPFGANSKLNEIANLFADMGDERAAKEGIQYDDEGRIVYAR